MSYIVELEPGVWVAPWWGDPGRTMVKSSAKRFGSMPAALRAMSKAREIRPFPVAKVEEVP